MHGPRPEHRLQMLAAMLRHQCLLVLTGCAAAVAAAGAVAMAGSLALEMNRVVGGGLAQQQLAPHRHWGVEPAATRKLFHASPTDDYHSPANSSASSADAAGRAGADRKARNATTRADNSVLVKTRARSPTRILVIWDSMSGRTHQLAELVAEGARSDQTHVTIKGVPENNVTCDDLRATHGLALGSPVYWGSMSGRMKTFIDHVRWGPLSYPSLHGKSPAALEQ